MKSLTTSIAAAVYSLFISCSVSAGEFLLHDGDTVVFLGDSITAARGYTKVIEHYSLVRLSSLDYRWIPIPEQLNRYMLRVEGLAEGSYKVTADGRQVQRLSAAQLAEGVNLGIMTPDPWEPGGPWNVQSDVVEELVDARDKLLYGQRLNTLYGIEDEGRRFDELDEQLTDLQHRTAQPRRYRFEIRLVKNP